MNIARVILLLHLLPLITDAAEPGPAALPDPADNAAFRERLHGWGLDPWLEQQAADLSQDPIEKRLLEREGLLARLEAQSRPTPAEREQVLGQASTILTELLAANPGHPSRFNWLLELARDDLERRSPEVFDNLLLYDLPGRDRRRAGELARAAVERLTALREQLARAWEGLSAGDEATLRALQAGGATGALERLDARSSLMLAWARFYAALAAQQPDAAAWKAVLESVTTEAGLTDLPPGREAEQASALLIACVAARQLRDFDKADAFVRKLVGVLPLVADPKSRQRMRPLGLVAVIEQIRAARDRRNPELARSVLEQARQWAAKARAGDPVPSLALAIAESTMEAQAALQAATRPASSLNWLPAHAVGPLQRYAAQSPEARDRLYAVLAAAIPEQVPELPACPEGDLLLGALVADAMGGHGLERLQIAVQLPDAQTAPERLYLLGRAFDVLGRKLEATGLLCDLVERDPSHDRAPQAARSAVECASQALQAQPASPPAREGFIRAVALFRERLPNDPTGRRLQFFLAAALEAQGRFEPAITAYAGVPAGDPNLPAAAAGRVRCWRTLLDGAVEGHRQSQAVIDGMAAKAVEEAAAARHSLEPTATNPAASRPSGEGCDLAQVVLLHAELLNHPAVHQHEQALNELADFESRFAACPPQAIASLRQQVLAHRELKQFTQARQLLQRLLAKDDPGSGRVMTELFQAMGAEIQTILDGEDELAAKPVADQAVKVGELLLEWAERHPGRIAAPDLEGIRRQRAWAMFCAAQARAALAEFEASAPAPSTQPVVWSTARLDVTLGQAECLLALGRHADALPLFMDVWRRAAEGTAPWWQAYVGSLRCNLAAGVAPTDLASSIAQQRRFSPELGGPRYQRQIRAIEGQSTTRPR